MTEVSEMIQTLHGFFQELTPDDMHEVWASEGLSKVVSLGDVTDSLLLDKFTVVAWEKSQEARSKLRCLQTLIAREASSHRLRQVVSARTPKSWQDVSMFGRSNERQASHCCSTR